MHSGECERWAAIPYGVGYEVSTLGRVRSAISNRVFKPRPRINGYISVSLQSTNGPKRFYVHRLVVAAFVRPLASDEMVNHLNFCRSDNRLSNLEIVTCKQNADYSKAAGRYVNNGAKAPRGEAHYKARLTREKVTEIRAAAADGVTLRDLGRKYQVSFSQIANVVRRISWSNV